MNISKVSLLIATILVISLSTFAQGNAVSSICERLNPTTSNWETVQTTSYTYNESDQLITAASQIFNAYTEELQNAVQSINEYDLDGELQTSTQQVWNTNTASWTNAQQIELNTKAQVVYNWNATTQDWTFASATENNTNSTPTRTSSAAWDHSQNIINQYDNQGRLTEGLVMTQTLAEDARQLRTTYHYADGTAKTAMQEETTLTNYPNPVVANTTVEFTLETAADVNIQLFDNSGRVVAVIANTPMQAGTKSIEFDATDLEAAIYHYQLVVNGQAIASNSMLVVAQ